MNRPTVTLVGAKARAAVWQGVNAIYEPVKRTLGPEGRTALLYRTFNRGSRITDDGVTVADTQEPKNPHVRLAAQAFKEMCRRTVEKVGDGTTTTAVIGGKLFNDVYAYLTENDSEFAMKKGNNVVGVVTLRNRILATAAKVKAAVKAKAIIASTLEDVERVVSISVKDAELGKVIAKMVFEVGVDGFIDVVEGYKGEIETEVIKGFRFPAKPAHKAFINNPARFEMVMQDCHVFITNYGLDNAAELGKVFQALNKDTTKIIVVAPSFSDNVLSNMVEAFKANYWIFPVKAPSLRTDQFEDLAINCGAQFVDKNKGRTIRNIKFSDLGFVEKMVVKDTEAREDAVVTGGAGTREELIESTEAGEGGEKKSAIGIRVEMLKSQLEETQQEQFKKLLERRIASMVSAVGVIRVGDSTQASALYRKLKIEDGVAAGKAALRGGFVKGGGLCLKEVVEELIDSGELKKDDICIPAFLHPYELIQGSVEGGIEITDDIIDPMEAIYYAVEHATGVVATLATVDVITPELEQMEPGDGEVMMARAIGETAIALKRHFGLIQENEVEMERDRMNGLSIDEMVSLDQG